MKIAFVGEERQPVLPNSGGGLARSTWEIATDLLELGHDVTLVAMEGSKFDGEIEERLIPREYDAYLDYSHEHFWSSGGFPKVVNLMGDRECKYTPPCALVESRYMQRHYPTARLVSQGCRVEDIPFSEKHGDYLVFMGGDTAHKQPDVAREVARRSCRELKIIGGKDEVNGAEKWKLLGGAYALLCPYTIDASPRSPLEAAACGTPTLCFCEDGTQDHVVDSMTGFVCKNTDAMVYWLDSARQLNSVEMRAWVEQEHDHRKTIKQLEKYLFAVANGEVW